MDNTIPGVHPGSRKEEAQKISMLVNSVYYFIECVYILILHDHYRLVALHNGRVLTNKTYKTIRGAKIAFSKLYRKKVWKEEIKAEWSHFYDPDADWLEEKIKDIEEKAVGSAVSRGAGPALKLPD